jgi:small subunit ribosomal protein S20
MANIKQQKKRIRTASEERLENLRYRSTIKTLTKKLGVTVEDGDSDAVATEHRTLVRWIDKAVSRGALHRNAGARKKSQAARLASAQPAPAPEPKVAASKAAAPKAAAPKAAASKSKSKAKS